MDRITALLNRRLAGIPAWVWGVVIGGSIALYAYLNREEGPNVAAETVPYVDEFAPGDAGDISGIPTVIDNSDDIPLESNPAWTRYVVDRMRIAGEDPTLVHNAITKVLAGMTISQAEAGMWNLIVSRYGPPPEGAPPINATPAPSGENGSSGRLPPPQNIRAKVSRRFSLRSAGKKVDIVVSWDKVDGAGGYNVRKVFPGTGTIRTAHTNRIKYSRQDAGPIYRFQVRGLKSGSGQKGLWGEGQVNT